MTPNPWRTVITTLVVCLMLLAAFVYGAHRGFTAESATAFGSLCLFSCSIALGQAAKGTLEQIANGTGFKGVAAALMTSSKPGDPAP